MLDLKSKRIKQMHPCSFYPLDKGFEGTRTCKMKLQRVLVRVQKVCVICRLAFTSLMSGYKRCVFFGIRYCTLLWLRRSCTYEKRWQQYLSALSCIIYSTMSFETKSVETESAGRTSATRSAYSFSTHNAVPTTY